jgi:competence protein ComEC
VLWAPKVREDVQGLVFSSSAGPVLPAVAEGAALVAAEYRHAMQLVTAWLAQARLADALATEWEGKDIQLIGVVASLPQTNERGVRFELDVENVITPRAGVPKHISLTWYKDRRDPEKPLPQLIAGERWQFTVRLKRPHSNANPHGFDYEAWLLERNIRATGYVRDSSENTRLDEWVMRPAYLVEHAREMVRKRLRSVLADYPYSGVLVALAVGDQQSISQPQWRVFTRTGVNHLMSISGLHVTMVAGLALALVYVLWKASPRLLLHLPARKAAALAGAIAAFLYALLAGFAVPAQRTVYMLTIVAAALWF